MSATKRFCQCNNCGQVNLDMLDEKKGKCEIIDDKHVKITYTCRNCGQKIEKTLHLKEG